ncbi:MAG TPA: hypothetical protein VMV69_20485 [Pirellulales bacterium]|nr:hypothetical protein [Pirellulales bacterium]
MVIDDGVRLPEGQGVTVLVPSQPNLVGQSHRLLDIPVVSLGSVLYPVKPDDELFGEMLKCRV